MKKILITGIGGDIAQGVARIIQQNYKNYELIGSDVHEQHGGSLFVDKVFQLPLASNLNYLSNLESLLTEEAIDIVIPMTEPELAVLGPMMERLNNLHWITAGKRVIEVGLDKFITTQVLNELGLPIPWTSLVDEDKPAGYPCILKKRTGTGSRSVFIIKDKNEAEYLAKSNKDAIYQELLMPADREVTCAVYRTLEGRVFILQMLRKLVGGFTNWATVINNEVVVTMCTTIAQGLDLKGSMNVQLRITESGPRVFEINPRFSSTVFMRHVLGFTDVLWSIDELEGKVLKAPSIELGRKIVRTQGAELLTI